MEIKKGFISIKGKSIEITFPPNVNLEAFENVLKKCYHLSLRTAYSNVKFNFKIVEWFDILQLSMLSLWILELTNRKKDISVIFPEKTDQVKFLEAYSFIDFLEIHGILTKAKSEEKVYRFHSRPFLPLTFFDSNRFNKLMSSLDKVETIDSIFQEIKSSEIIKKGIIKDILLQELGDNMYDHGGDGKFANIIMTKIRAKFPKKWEINNKDRIIDKDSVVIVLSDKGPGIMKTLIAAFEKDDTTIKHDKVTEGDIIEYSTNEHTTSRSTVERTKILEEKIEPEISDIIPFSGLFRTKETVKDYRGIMTIRSGKSFVIFDYYSDPGKEVIIKNIDIHGLKDLCNFGGTQVKIELPLLTHYDETYFKKTVGLIRRSSTKKVRYGYLRLEDYIKKEKDQSVEQLSDSYEQIINKFKKLSNDPSLESAVTDFRNLDFFSVKIQYLIICTILVWQEKDRKTHVVVNLPSPLIELINKSLSDKSLFSNNALFTIDEKYSISLIGGTSNDRALFQQLAKKRTIVSDEQTFLIHKYDRLFVGRERGENFDFFHNIYEILHSISDSLKNELASIIIDKENKIHHENIHVLTQHGKYFTEYFETYRLLINENWKSKLCDWIEYILIFNSPKYIISLSKYYGEFIGNILYTSKWLYKTNIKHINLDASLPNKELLQLAQIDEQKLLVLTDVIASGDTLLKLLKSTTLNISKIASIADLLQDSKREELSKLNIIIESIIAKPVTYDNSKPTNWKYSQLFLADSNKHNLLRKRPAPQPGGYLYSTPLSKTFAEKKLKRIHFTKESGNIVEEPLEVINSPFLTKLIFPNYAYYTRTIYDNRHQCVTIDFQSLLNVFGSKIAKDIENCIELLSKHEKFKLKHIIIFDEDGENNMQIIYSHLLTKFPDADILNIPYNSLDSYLSEDRLSGSDVLIIDDSIFSGDNYFRILEFCRIGNTSKVLNYVLINRSSSIIGTRVTNITKYGKTIVFNKHLFTLEIPAYSIPESPITKCLFEIENLSTIFEPFIINEYLKSRKEHINYIPYREKRLLVFNHINEERYFNLRWKCELAKNDMDNRKELSLMFEEEDLDISNILQFLAIIAQEKSIFLEDDSLCTEFFYSSFKAKVVNFCITYVSVWENNNNLNNIQDVLTVLYYLDESNFFQLLQNLKFNNPTNLDVLCPILTTLLLSKKEINTIMEKIDFLKKVHQYVSESKLTNGEDLMALLIFVERIWKSEKAQLFKNDLDEKIVYIRSLLKATFHDLTHKLNAFLKAILDKNIKLVISLWGNIKEAVRIGGKTLNKLNWGDIYDPEFEVVESIYSELSEYVKHIDVVVINLNTWGNNDRDFEDLLILYNSLENQIFGEEGIIEILKGVFKIDLKGLVVKDIEKLESMGITVVDTLTNDSCVVFCTYPDIVAILGNLVQNIEKAENAKNVLFKLYRNSTSFVDQIILELYNDSSSQSTIQNGIGINNCNDLAKKYSGLCVVENLSPSYELEGIQYNFKAQVILNDLADAVLNKTSNDG